MANLYFTNEDIQTTLEGLNTLESKQLIEIKEIEQFIKTIPSMLWSDNEQEDKLKKDKDLQEQKEKLNNATNKLNKTRELIEKLKTALNNNE